VLAVLPSSPLRNLHPLSQSWHCQCAVDSAMRSLRRDYDKPEGGGDGKLNRRKLSGNSFECKFSVAARELKALLGGGGGEVALSMRRKSKSIRFPLRTCSMHRQKSRARQMLSAREIEKMRFEARRRRLFAENPKRRPAEFLIFNLFSLFVCIGERCLSAEGDDAKHREESGAARKRMDTKHALGLD
jgi:hypothetical protein